MFRMLRKEQLEAVLHTLLGGLLLLISVGSRDLAMGGIGAMHTVRAREGLCKLCTSLLLRMITYEVE